MKLIVQHGGWPRITATFELKIRGWRNLPDCVQQLVRDHQDAIIVSLGLPGGLPSATDEEIAKLERWLSDGRLSRITGPVVVKPGWTVPGQMLAENVGRLLEGLRLRYGSRAVTLQHLHLFAVALEPIISSNDDAS